MGGPASVDRQPEFDTWLFPKARHDDLVDSTTQALKYLRDVGAVQFDDEVAAEEADRVRLRPRLQSLYPC